MASAFETALGGVQTDVGAKLDEATPYMIGIAALFLIYKLTKRVVRSIL